MIEAAKISINQMRNSILSFGAVACAIYIAFLLLMKAFDLLQVTELRWFNYVILCFLCVYQIKRWVRKTGKFVPFLVVFFTTFFTGAASFLMFGIFTEIYMKLDEEFYRIFLTHTPESLTTLPSTLIVFEGTAVSIIVGFISLQYFRRYEEEIDPGAVKQNAGQKESERKTVS